jgi:hypothetical protein
MKTKFGLILKEAIENRDLRGFSSKVDNLVKDYNVSEKTIYNRFKSQYGKSPREVILESIMPSKEELDSVIMGSSSSEEVREKVRLSNRMFTGIYDKYYGVSTFQKARIKILSTYKKPILSRNQREDNRALIYSQILGDGSYNRKRHSLRITHGIKQAEYLRWKADLIGQAYPKLKGPVTQHLHKQGHEYVNFYCNLGNIDIPQKEEDCVELLTPLGWCLWYFDDGFYSQNYNITCSRNPAIVEKAIEELKTYGIDARKSQYGFCMKGQENDYLFYVNFLQPFGDMLPKCIKYKVEDIVGSM